MEVNPAWGDGERWGIWYLGIWGQGKVSRITELGWGRNAMANWAPIMHAGGPSRRIRNLARRRAAVVRHCTRVGANKEYSERKTESLPHKRRREEAADGIRVTR